MNGNYNDIIDRERPVHRGDAFEVRHPKMHRQLRAKQFAPFDALAGFTETVEEHQAVTVRPKELSQEERETINDRLLQIQEDFLAWKRGRKGIGQELLPVRASVTFFLRNARQEEIHRDGVRGDAETVEGNVTAFDAVSQTLRVNGVSIPFSAIYSLKVSN